ncbi:MAG: hypothetical protein ACK57R_21530 [Dolichospermum sp.]|jgi:hypothetical protein|nr:hypothetical protein [Anabaena sp. 49628_E55]
MKKFRDLYIYLNSYDIDQLIKYLTDNCINNWSRAYEREKNAVLLEEKAYCFEHTAGDGLESAGLILFQKDPNTWFVSNIVPTEKGQLSVDEYNQILVDFFTTIVQPAIENTPVSTELTNDQEFIENLIGNDAAALLNQFATYANKFTVTSHPGDRKKWFDFILSVNSKGVKLDPNLLSTSLIEKGWSQEAVDKLVTEYEFADALLNYTKGQ